MQLTELELDGNALSGLLPEPWANLTQVTIVGPAVACASSCTALALRILLTLQLRYVDISNNSLEGCLPASWSKLTHVCIAHIYLVRINS